MGFLLDPKETIDPEQSHPISCPLTRSGNREFIFCLCSFAHVEHFT